MSDMDEEMNRLSRAALARLEKITPDERRQLGHILTMLAECYGEGAKGRAVVAFRMNEEVTALLGVNTNDMFAAEMLRDAAEIMAHALVVDAPPKEMFN